MSGMIPRLLVGFALPLAVVTVAGEARALARDPAFGVPVAVAALLIAALPSLVFRSARLTRWRGMASTLLLLLQFSFPWLPRDLATILHQVSPEVSCLAGVLAFGLCGPLAPLLLQLRAEKGACSTRGKHGAELATALISGILLMISLLGSGSHLVNFVTLALVSAAVLAGEPGARRGMISLLGLSLTGYAGAALDAHGAQWRAQVVAGLEGPTSIQRRTRLSGTIEVHRDVTRRTRVLVNGHETAASRSPDLLPTMIQVPRPPARESRVLLLDGSSLLLLRPGMELTASWTVLAPGSGLPAMLAGDPAWKVPLEAGGVTFPTDDPVRYLAAHPSEFDHILLPGDLPSEAGFPETIRQSLRPGGWVRLGRALAAGSTDGDPLGPILEEWVACFPRTVKLSSVSRGLTFLVSLAEGAHEEIDWIRRSREILPAEDWTVVEGAALRSR